MRVPVAALGCALLLAWVADLEVRATEWTFSYVARSFSSATLTTVSPVSAEDVAALIEADLKTARVPGAAIAVVNGEDVVVRGVGIANADTGAAMDADTLVHLGSVTKLLTALAVSTALDARKLSPATPVGRVVDGLSPRAAAATFDELLSQTAGLRDRAGDDGTDDEAALVRGARALTDADFILPGGAVFSYTNLGYALAGAGLEGLLKQPYADAMRNLFVSLGMTRSTLRPRQATSSPHARGHRRDADRLIVVQPLANDTRIWPAGYAWSTAADMARLLAVLLHQGRRDGKQVLPASIVSRVTSPHAPMPNVFAGGHYGYGLMIARDRGLLIYEHGGTVPGFSSIVRLAPERGLGIAILTNLDNAPLRRVAQNVMAKGLGLADQPASPRTETPLTPDEMQPFLGRYRNRGTADLAVRDGRVVLMLDEGAPFAVSRLEANRFLARPAPNVAGPEFVLEQATPGRPAYLHFALWAYVKEGG